MCIRDSNKALLGAADYQGGPTGISSLLSKFPGGGIGAAITAASLLPLLGIGTGEEDEDEAQAILQGQGLDINAIRANPNQYLARAFKAEGGSMDEPVAKKTMPLLDMGGQEMDLRAEGGFVPIGRMEKQTMSLQDYQKMNLYLRLRQSEMQVREM